MPRKAPKMKGKFPHYDCQIQTGVTLPRTPTGKAKSCKACKAALHVGDFTISESGTIILDNGRVDECGGPTMWTNWYHGVNCFGFYSDTLRDDKIRVGKIAKKLGLPATPAAALFASPLFQAEYDQELLKRRFSGFDGLPANEQRIVRTIMQKGAYAAGDPLVAVAAGGAAAAAPAAAAAAAAAGVVAGKKRKSAADADAESDAAEDDGDDAAAAEEEDGGKKKKARASSSAASAASSKKKKATAASRKK